MYTFCIVYEYKVVYYNCDQYSCLISFKLVNCPEPYYSNCTINVKVQCHNYKHECLQYIQIFGNCYTIVVITINELVVGNVVTVNSGLKSMKSLTSIPILIVVTLSSTVSAAGNSKLLNYS